MSRVAASFPHSSLRSSLEKLAAIYYRLKNCCNLLLQFANLFSNIKSNPVLRFSDKYSYHIYLVHQVFILGPLSLMTVTSNLLLNISIICCCILCSGLILKKINNFVDKILTVIKAKIIRKILINNRSLHLK